MMIITRRTENEWVAKQKLILFGDEITVSTTGKSAALAAARLAKAIEIIGGKYFSNGSQLNVW